MARKRRSGGRRKGFNVTPKNLAKLGLVIGGISAGKPLYNEAKYIITHADQIGKEGGASMLQHGKQLAQAAVVPAAMIVVAPKVLDKAVAFANKGTPLVNRIANAKVARI